MTAEHSCGSVWHKHYFHQLQYVLQNRHKIVSTQTIVLKRILTSSNCNSYAFQVIANPEANLQLLEIIFLGIMLNTKIEIFFPFQRPLSSISLLTCLVFVGKGQREEGTGT